MEWNELAEEARDVWRENAPFWADHMGESGDEFHRLLIAPAAERLLDARPGWRVLEIACGAGHFARRLAAQGVEVVACDGSEPFVEWARARPTAGVSYHVTDATDRDALLALGEPATFDAAVCNMTLMDLPAIDPLLAALTRLLKPGGRFVFTVLHPVFMAPDATRVAEAFDQDGQIVTRLSLKISHYQTPIVFKGVGVVGQPKMQYYFHRSISDLFGHCFKFGFMLGGMEEPAFETGTAERTLSWVNLHQIPPILAARMVLTSEAA